MLKTEWDYTALADSYQKRPGYCRRTLNQMFTAMGLAAGSRVCDVGAGTGHLTLPLAEAGFQVIAVEPNDAMRRLSERQTTAFPRVRWRVGTGEDTGLPASEFDLVIFGSSFNVTDRTLALRESARIMKSGGWFACLWNHRDLTDSLQGRIEKLIQSRIENYDYGVRREDQAKVIEDSGLFGKVQTLQGRIVHAQSVDDCLEAWRSHATLHRQAGERWEAVLEEISKLLASAGKMTLQIPYLTKIWFAQKKELTHARY